MKDQRSFPFPSITICYGFPNPNGVIREPEEKIARLIILSFHLESSSFSAPESWVPISPVDCCEQRHQANVSSKHNALKDLKVSVSLSAWKCNIHPGWIRRADVSDWSLWICESSFRSSSSNYFARWTYPPGPTCVCLSAALLVSSLGFSSFLSSSLLFSYLIFLCPVFFHYTGHCLLFPSTSHLLASNHGIQTAHLLLLLDDTIFAPTVLHLNRASMLSRQHASRQTKLNTIPHVHQPALTPSRFCAHMCPPLQR